MRLRRTALVSCFEKMEASPHTIGTCSCSTWFSLSPAHVPLLHAFKQAAKKSSAAFMADNEGARGHSGSHNGDKKRKYEDRGGRRGGRGGRPMQHGSRPNKKRNLGRKELK